MADFIRKYDINNIDFKLGKPIKPIEQLLSVLPPQSSYLIPDNCTWLMKSYKSPIIHLYPTDYDLDMLYKRKYWECIPILPDLDICSIKSACKNIKLTDRDEKKNRIVKEVIY